MTWMLSLFSLINGILTSLVYLYYVYFLYTIVYFYDLICFFNIDAIFKVLTLSYKIYSDELRIVLLL